MQSGLDDELAVLYEHVLVGERRLLKFSISVASQYKFGIEETSNSYPNPPTSASFVQIEGFSPEEKSSLKTGQYLWCTTDLRPS